MGRPEVGEMSAQLIVGVVMETLDSCVLDRTVYAFDLSAGGSACSAGA